MVVFLYNKLDTTKTVIIVVLTRGQDTVEVNSQKIYSSCCYVPSLGDFNFLSCSSL